MSGKENKTSKLVTTITGINDNIFYLYDNGKVYRKNEKDDLIELNQDDAKDKEIIEKIFNRFKNLKTDVKK